jgi:hypothetical protein
MTNGVSRARDFFILLTVSVLIVVAISSIPWLVPQARHDTWILKYILVYLVTGAFIIERRRKLFPKHFASSFCASMLGFGTVLVVLALVVPQTPLIILWLVGFIELEVMVALQKF